MMLFSPAFADDVVVYDYNGNPLDTYDSNGNLISVYDTSGDATTGETNFDNSVALSPADQSKIQDTNTRTLDLQVQVMQLRDTVNSLNASIYQSADNLRMSTSQELQGRFEKIYNNLHQDILDYTHPIRTIVPLALLLIANSMLLLFIYATMKAKSKFLDDYLPKQKVKQLEVEIKALKEDKRKLKEAVAGIRFKELEFRKSKELKKYKNNMQLGKLPITMDKPKKKGIIEKILGILHLGGKKDGIRTNETDNQQQAGHGQAQSDRTERKPHKPLTAKASGAAGGAASGQAGNSNAGAGHTDGKAITPPTRPKSQRVKRNAASGEGPNGALKPEQLEILTKEELINRLLRKG